MVVWSDCEAWTIIERRRIFETGNVEDQGQDKGHSG